MCVVRSIKIKKRHNPFPAAGFFVTVMHAPARVDASHLIELRRDAAHIQSCVDSFYYWRLSDPKSTHRRRNCTVN